jgi:hypothetical protein
VPTLDSHQSNQITKLLLIGDSGTGKTGALASLALAGYRLFILDFDNGLDSLVANIRRVDGSKLGNVEFESLRDKIKSVGPSGPIFNGLPDAFSKAMKLLDKWGDKRPAEFGPESVVVIDSLTFLSEAAFNWALSLNPTAKDRRQIYGAAQDAIENVLAMLTGKDFNTNVVVISHVKYMERPDGTTKGYPTSVGAALSPKIPTYFNSVALCETTGVGASVRRTIRTQSSALIDLKNPESFKIAPQLPIESALADFFKTLKGETK